MNKKGMEMWEIIGLILAVAFLLFLIVWYGLLDNDLGGLLTKLGDLL
ncbi:MAG TPA: hypothetical protein VJA23_00770 [Candidatus Nanoarchaeia archaeon]|nr:hypothetical protein [Candidatus Nanoarchaeia archaeon]